MKLVLFLLLFCSVYFLSAQNHNSIELLTFQELDSIMVSFYNQGNYKKAIIYAEHGTSKAKEEFGDKDSIYTEYLSDLGFFYDQTGQYKKAEKVFLKTLSIEGKVLGKTHPSYIESLNNLAAIYQKLGWYEKAARILKQSLDTEQSSLNNSLILNNLASLYREIGQYKQAEQLLLKALEKISSTKDNLIEYANTLTNLALVYDKVGRYQESENLFLKILDIRAQAFGKIHPEYANTLNNLAALYYKLNRYEQAEQLYIQAIEIDKKTLSTTHPSYGINLNNLAELYRKTKDNRRAKILYLESKKLWEKTYGKKHRKYATSLNNLALLHFDLKEFDKAEKLYLEAQLLLEQIIGKDHPDYSNTLNNLANLYLEIQEYDKAEHLYKQTISLRKQTLGLKHPNYLKSLNDLAKMYLHKKSFEKALDIISVALIYNCKDCTTDTLSFIDNLKYIDKYNFNSNEEVIRSLEYIYNVAYKKYQHKKAKLHLQKAHEVLQVAISFSERIKNSFNDEKAKLRVLKQISNLAYKSIAIGLLLNKDTKTEKKYLASAFTNAELNKSILLADAIKGEKARNLSDLPDSLALQEVALFEKKKLLEKERLEAPKQSQLKIRGKINQLEIEIDLFLKKLKQKYPKYYALKYKKSKTRLKDVQANLTENAMLIEYFIADTVVYLFCIEKSQFEIHTVKLSKTKLNYQIKKLRKALSNYKFIKENPKKGYIQYTQSAFWFYQTLLEPALKNKKTTQLIIITDGELGHLPFETFLTKAPNQHIKDYKTLDYLIKKYTISYNYSAKLWIQNKNIQKEHNHKILAYAGDYTSLDSTFQVDNRTVASQKVRKSLVPLPAVQEEVNMLANLFGGTFLQHKEANEASFKANANEYGVIHLAMHGILHQRIPILSSLAFTENQDTIEDNFLQAYEISHLKLNAELVVLSACETGYGKFEQGEGIISLARSFMYAGVPSLVVSLWQVNDASTAIIMKHFYQDIAKGIPKDVALRQAKLDYIKSVPEAFRHPIFWSPFIQLGTNIPISISVQNTHHCYILYFLAVLIFVFFIKRNITNNKTEN